jgi:hypothetical protein
MPIKERIRQVTGVVLAAIRDPQPGRVAEANDQAARLLPDLRIYDPEARVWLAELELLTATVRLLGDTLGAQR